MRRALLAMAIAGGSMLSGVTLSFADDQLSAINNVSITSTAEYYDPNLTGSTKSRLGVSAAGAQLKLSSIITIPEDMLFTIDTAQSMTDKTTSVENGSDGDVTAFGYFELDGYRSGDQSTFFVDACGACMTYSVSQQQ